MKSDYTPSWKLPELPAFMQHKERKISSFELGWERIFLLCIVFLFICHFGNSQNNTDDLLYSALIDGNIKDIKRMTNSANINCIFKNGYTPLMIAIENGNFPLVKFFVKHGADVGLWKNTPNQFIEWANNDDYDLLKRYRYLYKDSVFSNGYTPLMLAVKTGNKQIVKYLIKKGADINEKDLLTIACKNNNTDLSCFLAKMGANVNVISENVKTPLMYAAENRNLEICKCLIKNGSNPNLLFGVHTPLMEAASTGQLEMVELLVRSGANINAIDTSNNKTTLIYAIVANQLDIYRKLLEFGCSVNDSKLIFYVLRAPSLPLLTRYKMVQQLVELGVNVNDREGLDGSLYVLDAALPYFEIYDFLLKNGATQYLYDGISNNEE
jgi:ankyrin repeat protein